MPTNREAQGEVERIVAGLTETQARYLLAVGKARYPYEPRHGRSANWALKQGFAETIIILNDGREGPWDSFSDDDRFGGGIAEILGQRLTPLGLAVRQALQTQEPDHG